MIRTHHAFSPSQLQALECCPSYEGQQSSSKAAETGIRQHTAAETGQDDNALTDEEALAVMEARRFVAQQKQLLEEARTKSVNSKLSCLGSTVEEAEKATPPVREFSEIYLSVDAEDTTGGFADKILISHDGVRAILVDHKFGAWGVAEARQNRQSDAYSLGIFHAYPTVESVEVCFFQPASKAPNNTVWKRSDVPELLLRIRVIVARAKAAREAGDFSSAVPHTPVCLFCKHLARCPLVAEKVISVAKKFSPVEVDALDLTPTRVHSPEEAATGLRLAGLVEAWSKAFKSLVTNRALSGGPIPTGYKLTSRSTREIVDVTRLKQVALMFLTADEVETTVDIAVTKIEKLIADNAPRGSKTASIEAFQAASLDAGAIKEGQPYAFLKVRTE